MKIMPLFFLMALSITARSQKEGSFYVFDADWKATKLETAHFFLHVHQVDDSCWQWDYYNFTGPLLKTEQFRDKDGKELHGVSRYYKADGILDSTATYRRGKKNGDFLKLNSDSFAIVMKYVYRDDSLIEVVDLSKPKKDSAVRYADEKESEYPGGVGQWMRFLNKNLKYPERAVNASISGDVKVLFIVDKEGITQDPYIAKSVEYSLDEESLRIIHASGKWVPAFQNGKLVKTYKIQPIHFRLQ